MNVIRLKVAGDARTEQVAANAISELDGLLAATVDPHTDGWQSYDLTIHSTAYPQTSLLAIAEVKTRHNVNHDDFFDAPVAKLKLRNLLGEAQRQGVVPLFIIQYSDVIRWIDARRCVEGREGIIRRTKPRASGLGGCHDTEYGYYVPQEWFANLSELPAFLNDSVGHVAA